MFAERYRLVSKLGEGGFGAVFSATEGDNAEPTVAIKMERIRKYDDAALLETEMAVYAALAGTAHVPRVLECGEYETSRFIAMDLLGRTLDDLHYFCGDHFSLKTVLMIIEQTLSAMESLHRRGYVYRDVKPSNFLLQQHSSSPLVLIDFGLCKRHLDPETKEPLPEAPSAKFTGTKKYASMRAHNGKDLARCDDVMSWFYSVVEIWQGNLPWTEIAESKKMCTAKEEMDIEVLCDGMPHKFVDIWNMIKDLEYADKPDYDGIIAIIDEIVTEVGGGPVDWNALYAANSNLGDLRKSMTAPPSARSVQSGDAKQEAPGEGHGEGKCCEVQ